MSCICGKVIYTNNSKSIVLRSGFGQAWRTIATTRTTGTSTLPTRTATTTTAMTPILWRSALAMKNLAFYEEVYERGFMAQYHHLPLYRTTYALLLELMHITKNFPREFKYSIGEKIQNYITEVLLCIYRANSSKDKSPHIFELLEQVELLNVLLRVSFDLKILPMEKYADIIEKTGSISRQATGWLKV